MDKGTKKVAFVGLHIHTRLETLGDSKSNFFRREIHINCETRVLQKHTLRVSLLGCTYFCTHTQAALCLHPDAMPKSI